MNVDMGVSGKILNVFPHNALPGGEIEVIFDGLQLTSGDSFGCLINGLPCRIVSASSTRVVAHVPEYLDEETGTEIYVHVGPDQTDRVPITIAARLVDGMHIVANPAIDPKDGAIIITRSGGRGQQLPNTLYRLEQDGFLDELPVEIMNPTGIAFGADSELYVTNRRDGILYRIENGTDATPIAKDLGIATGLAFDTNGVAHVGDRSGTIYRISDEGVPDGFAKLDPSVAAYHMAFGPDGRLYVSAPGLASHEAVYAIDPDGKIETYFRGFGRPQGIAFAADGTMYIAACYGGRRGIFAVKYQADTATHLVAGNMIVGLCFNAEGDLIVATGDSIYSLPLGIKGTLLT